MTIDVRTLGTKIDDLECDHCERQSNDLARYEHPLTHLYVIACGECARKFMADELAELEADDPTRCPCNEPDPDRAYDDRMSER